MRSFTICFVGICFLLSGQLIADTAKGHKNLKNIYWPNFRGTFGLGVSKHHEMGTNRSILWKAKIPLPGYSSPIIWNTFLFITGGNKKQRSLFCYHALSGKLLWRHNTSDIMGDRKVPKVSHDTGYAASTVATDGKYIFAIFATGSLVCVDFKGKRIWKKHLGIPKNPYGYSSSLLAIDNTLLVQYDDEENHILYCFSSSTGKILWKIKRHSSISWSSPSYIETSNQKLVIILTSQDVQAYDFVTGKQVWSNECMAGEIATSPTYNEKNIFVANSNASSYAITPSNGKILWENGDVVLPDVASPVVYKDMLFLCASSGTISCVNTANGKLFWEKDLDEGFYSSPLIIKDRLVVFDMNGRMYVIKPSTKKLIIEKQWELKDKVVATPAFANNRMWVRGIKYLYCIGNGK